MDVESHLDMKMKREKRENRENRENRKISRNQ